VVPQHYESWPLLGFLSLEDSQQSYFYRFRWSASRPTTNLGDQASVFIPPDTGQLGFLAIVISRTHLRGPLRGLSIIIRRIIINTYNNAQSVHCLTTEWTTGIRSPAEAKNFSSSFCVQTSSEAHPASYPMSTEGPCSEGKARPRRDADHSPPSSAEVENEKELYPSPPWRLYGGRGTDLLYFYQSPESTKPVQALSTTQVMLW
jgi:hypothetical protein